MNRKRRLSGDLSSVLRLTILGFLLLISQASGGVITGDLTVSTATVGATAQLNFEANLATLVPISGKLTMIFSVGVNLLESTSIVCSSVYAVNNASACTVTSQSVLTLNNADTSENFIMFKVQNIKLPAFVSTFSVTVQTYSATGTLIDQSASTVFTFTTKPGVLTVIMAPISSVVGKETDIQMSFFSTNQISTSGSVILQLPKWNAGTQTLNTISFLRYETIPQNLNGQYILPCSSSSNPQIQCLLTINQPNQISAISTTYDSLVISGFANSFTQLIVTTSGTVFRNPPSTKVVSTFSAQSRTSLGQLVTAATVVSVKVSQAAVLSLVNANLTCSSNELDSQNTYSFTFKMDLPGPVGLKIKIVIPNQMSIYSRINPTQLVLNSVAALPPLYEIPYLAVTDATTQTVTLSNLVPNQNYYVDQGSYVQFNLISIVNPSSVQQSDSFQITFLEYDDPIMTVESGLFVTPKPGALTKVTIEPQGYRVRDTVPYKISFITQNQLFADSAIVVKIPSQVQVDQNLITVTGLTTMNTQNVISTSYSDGFLTIKGGFTSNFATSQLVEFLINTGIQNGPSSEPVTGFFIQTLDSKGAVIDQGTQAEALVFTPNEITAVGTQACSDKQTSSQTEDVCTYKLQIMIGSQFPILSGSIIQIDLPQDLTLFNVADTIAKSSTVGISDLSSTISVSANQTTIIVNNAFSLQSAPNGVNYVQDSFAVQIASVKSPRSTAPTLSFKIRILTQDGYLQYTKVQGIYANVFEARPFQTTVISRSNQMNGNDSGVYNFTLQLSSTIYKNEYIQITPPSQISIFPGGADQCRGIRLLQSKLACTIIQGSLYILIAPLDQSQTSFQPGDTVQFQVSSIKNPLSLEPTSSFNIFISTSTSQPKYVNQMVQGLSIINVVQGVLTDVRVSPDTNQLGSVTNYGIYFTTDNDLPVGSIIIVTFPYDYYSFVSPMSCFAIKNIGTQIDCTIINSTQVQVTNGYQTPLVSGTEVGIKLQNIRNPEKSVPSSVINQQFLIQTFTAAKYGIDQSENLDFQIGCTYPCLNCENTLSTCTSCQMLDPATPLFLYQNTCNEVCPIGSYPDSNFQCSLCNQPCATCAKGPAICDSCIQSFGFPFVTPSGSCVKTCESGFYADPTTMSCQQCSGNCKSCTSAINCLTCDPKFYYIQGQCLESCPSNSIKFDSVEVQECLACKQPCATCQNKVDECTSCSPSTFLYQTTCLASCPRMYLPDSNKICQKSNQLTLPFISQVMTLIIVLLILASKSMDKLTKGFTAFIALESVAMIFFWIYMLVFLIADQHTASATIVSVALIGNFTVNYLWYEFYNDSLKKQDVNFQEYRLKYPKTDRFIKFFAVLTSFQFFRIIYSWLFKSEGLKAEFQLRAKYYRRMNRYTLFQITFTMVPTMVASIYNLFYTWYGRQIFWIDIENLVWCSCMIVLHLIVLFRAEREYIKKILNIPENPKVMATIEDDDDISHTGIEEQNTKKQALRVAKKIQEEGVGESRLRIKGLTAEQRIVAMKAVFSKLISGDDPETKVGKEDKFKFKHGINGNYKTHHPQTKPMIDEYQEVNGDTLGATQNVDMTETNFEETQQIPLNQALRKETMTRQQKKQLISSDFITTEEDDILYNFQSAPLNAQSALQGNKGLEERHKKLQNELKERIALHGSPGKNLQIVDIRNKSKRGRNGKLPQPTKTEMQGTVETGFALDLSEDSDDQIEQFDSHKWGKGTSKVVAEHFNTVQVKNQALNSQYSQFSKNKGDKVNSKGTLTQQDFEKVIEEIKHQKLEKRVAKERAFEFVESINELDQNLTIKRDENLKLSQMIKELERQIAGEVDRLNKVTLNKNEEINFAENAFYTSDEDGMGVSPNNYVSQNKMPRPGRKERTPPREVPFGQTSTYEQILLQEQILQSENKLHERVPSGFSKNNVSNNGGISLHSGRAGNIESAQKQLRSTSHKSITAAEIKSISDNSYIVPTRPVALAKTDASFYRNGQNEFDGIHHEGPQSTHTKVKHRGENTPQKSQRSANARSSSGSIPRRRSSVKKRGHMQVIPESTDQEANAPGTTSGSARGRGEVQRGRERQNMLSHRSTRPLAKSVNANSGPGHFGGTISVDGKDKKPKQMSDSGLKMRIPPHFATGKLLVSDVLASNRFENRQLNHKPLYQENNKLEYQTSDDDLGNVVNKLRKKGTKKTKEEKKKTSKEPKQQRDLNHSPIYIDDEDMEYYTSTDNQGQTVQKLRRKGKSPFDKLRDQIQDKRTGKQTVIRQNARNNMGQNAGVNDFNFRPQFNNDSLDQSTIQGSILNHTNQDFNKYSATSARENNGPDKTRSRSNLIPPQVPTTFNETEVRGRNKVWAHDSQRSTVGRVSANGGIVDRGQHASTLQEAGLMQTTSNKPKITGSSQKKKKRSAPARDFGEVYFNHTNFERAVIATNGRAPYNNKEVDKMTRNNFDPNAFSFKNNWVSALNNDNSRLTNQPNSSPPGQRRRGRDFSETASIAATTVFQGLNQSQRVGETPIQQTANLQQLSTTQQQFFGGSPILLLGVGSHMKTGNDQASNDNNNLVSLGQTPLRQRQLQYSATNMTDDVDKKQSEDYLNWTQTPSNVKK